MLAAGTSEGLQLAFSDPEHGFLTVSGFGEDEGNAYVLRTVNGGASWHPQEITAGSIPSDGILAGSWLDASLLIDGVWVSNTPLERQLFTTTSGGDVGGAQASLTLSTHRRSFTRRALRRAHDTIIVNGTLGGALGGEQIVVSRRNLAGGTWQRRTSSPGPTAAASPPAGSSPPPRCSSRSGRAPVAVRVQARAC